MRVLSFDPGYERLGVAVLEKKKGAEILLFSSCITTNKKKTLSERLSEIGAEVKTVIQKQKPDCVALEKLFFNVNQKTAIAVAETRGVLLFIAGENRLPVYEYSPQEVKIAATGYGKSSKEQVADMVRKLVTIEKKIQYDDEYDAIAVGLTCLASIKP